MVFASAWQPRRGRKVQVEESPSDRKNRDAEFPEKDPAERVTSICLPRGRTSRSEVIHNPPVEGTGTVLSFIGGLMAGDGEAICQNPSLATVDRERCAEGGTTERHNMAPRPTERVNVRSVPRR